ncbi:Zn-ribbon domain-containing OB-fold protein [Nocardia callitridis]|uniref:OB-fold domain-containing protein n=1 Tax=Nocardia callitridis TaxID=648753 RepID=A0ABP9KL04_9NOCA
MTTEPKPVPIPTPLTAPFWAAAQRHEIALQRCGECSAAIGYPRLNCPNCGGRDLDWFTATGRGRVWSYVVVERADPTFAPDVPYVLAVIELDEGPRLLSIVVDVVAAYDMGLLDLAVRASFETRGAQQVPIFVPIGEGA